MGREVCYFCGKEGAKQQCGSCSQVWACSGAHLRLHWREEEPACYPWTVQHLDNVGRVMVTTRDVAAGETLFREDPIVIGPNQVGSPICLACYSSVSLNYRCTSCGYPLCGPQCQASPVHEKECSILSRGPSPSFEGNETEAYHCILPLRLVLLARTDPQLFSLSERLMDHEEDRRESADWKTTERTVVKHILEDCRGADIEGISVEEMRRAIGVLEVNCYEVHSFVRCGFRGCFPAASLLSHSCIANSRHLWTMTPPYTNTCIATVDIPKGEEVLTSYVIPTMCSLLRRPRLQEGWYFLCSCPRCSSPTELDSHQNTVVCGNCSKAALLPVRPLELGSEWMCTACNHTTTESAVKTTVTSLLDELKKLTVSDRYHVDKWLELDSRAARSLHPQHEVRIEIAKWLVSILCRSPTTVNADYPRHRLLAKMEMAQRQLAVLDIVDSGYSKTRVKALYEVLETELYLAISDPQLDPSRLEDDPTWEKLLSLSVERAEAIVRVFDRLGTNEGFETILKFATMAIRRRCQILQEAIKAGRTTDYWQEFKEGWSLLLLWKWRE